MRQIKKAFPFHAMSDEEIQEHIELARTEIKSIFRERDFEDIDLLMMCRTLHHLELERKQRRTKH
ncbi:hypothetical protein FZD47_24000 [Bacillus infantis]|uniref:Uncharacterized protein n=1 Tax=Bacillus infantis TaxID=324767 RepID=A0A5D4S805_9BACI|nr:hypothetical protein [Bacillus infantis]TYS57902.1 hypothetical protein FZD47_24000 [Bacillus infantis]